MRRKFIKDHPYCSRCGIEEGPFELDHIIERQFGGSNDEDNYQLLCKPCHRDKGQESMARVG
ncbi:MAG: HNH endonuclease signature motif containing protein [Chitinophagaceae bacterium]